MAKRLDFCYRKRMSELFAWIGKWPKTLEPPLERLLRPKTETASTVGWGLSGFSVERAVYFGRHVQPSTEDVSLFQKAFERAEHTKPNVFVAQGQTVPGALEIRNTGPFHHRDWIFAEIGRVPSATMVVLQDARPQGTTAEERFFLWLAERMLPAMHPTEDLITLIQDKCRVMPFKNLTFLVSDGKMVWVYHEINQKSLEKKETLADRQRQSTLYYTTIDDAMALCTTPLPELSNDWQLFPSRTLAVITVEPFTSILKSI